MPPGARTAPTPPYPESGKCQLLGDNCTGLKSKKVENWAIKSDQTNFDAAMTSKWRKDLAGPRSRQRLIYGGGKVQLRYCKLHKLPKIASHVPLKVFGFWPDSVLQVAKLRVTRTAPPTYYRPALFSRLPATLSWVLAIGRSFPIVNRRVPSIWWSKVKGLGGLRDSTVVLGALPPEKPTAPGARTSQIRLGIYAKCELVKWRELVSILAPERSHTRLSDCFTARIRWISVEWLQVGDARLVDWSTGDIATSGGVYLHNFFQLISAAAGDRPKTPQKLHISAAN
uniref:HDC06257 n=1 Tax=Drosophila melanogaster TaxID=7227 RepID=Q6IGH6_DROME|nr:TPA_inf: HDC06257 [Drosophila melanogaster]